jgi:uncharacterized protein (DUF2249 family)
MATTHRQVIDLHTLPPGMRAHTYAYYALRELRPGEEALMLCPEDPQLLLSQLQLDLRHRLATQIVADEAGWQVLVRHREDTEADSLFDILSRDHERLDRLFVRTMEAVAAGRIAEAKSVVGDFLDGLRRHIDVENDVLAPRFALPRDPAGSDPTSIMLREHDDILRQAVIIEELFAGPDPDATEIDTWCGILAATLSKHEGREEMRLFPQWDAHLVKQPEAPRVLAEVRALIAGQPARRATA